MKFSRVILHVLQVGIFVGMYELQDLYNNHLGFMRNVSFYQNEFQQQPISKLILPISLLALFLAAWIFFKLKTLEAGLGVLSAILLLGWQSLFSLETQVIYYLISGCLLLIYLVQLLNVFLKRKEEKHDLQSKNARA